MYMYMYMYMYTYIYIHLYYCIHTYIYTYIYMEICIAVIWPVYRWFIILTLPVPIHNGDFQSQAVKFPRGSHLKFDPSS